MNTANNPVDSFEPYAFRIQATGEAQKRTRSAFLVATIASLAVLVACWNAYASWYRHFAHKLYWMGSTESNQLLADPASGSGTAEGIPVPQELHRLTLERWVDSQQISIPILGISIGVSDIAVLGSFGLFISAFWLYHALRRENQAIGHLLIETRSLDAKMRDQIFHSVAAYLVFTRIDDTETPIYSLEDARTPPKRSTFGRRVFRLMLYLPAASILAGIAFDLSSVFLIEPAFRFPRVELWKLMGPPEWTQFALMEAFALLFCSFTFGLCNRAAEFEKATGEVLSEYQNRLEPAKK